MQEIDNLRIKLLKYDLLRFAKKLGLIENIEECNLLTDRDATQLLNFVERKSRNKALDDDTQQLCITICGLLWENRKKEWEALPSFLVQALIRLGYAPSAKMVDLSFDEEKGQFGSLGSIISELYSTRRLIEHEVTVGENHSLMLSDFQKRMWDCIDEYSRLGISAPTSAGKSYVLVNKLVDSLYQRPGEVVYIVPTKSLINQVTNDIKKTLNRYNLGKYDVLQTYSQDYAIKNQNAIYVLTQERGLAAFNQNKEPFKNLKLLIIDEIQNIERVSNESEERAHILYDLIKEFDNNTKLEKVVISGPRIENIQKLVTDLFGKDGKGISADSPPVVNITYTFSKENSKVYFNQYSTIINKSISIPIEKVENICCFGQKQYTDKFHNYLTQLMTKLNDSGSIIFSPTSLQSVKTAKYIAEQSEAIQNADELKELRKYVQNSVHPNYSLADMIPKGIGYHHGKLPDHIRLTMEAAFSKQLIKILVTTTTLMQGMNLPAKYLIARSPNLFTRKKGNNECLTAYEFANLRGRAGRLMKDFVGRVIILDESSFSESENYLNKFENKEVYCSYGDRFSENKDQLLDALFSAEEVSEETQNNDLVVYIRQMVLKYGNEALNRINQVGIEISEIELKEIESQLQNLKVPVDICVKNPYWDPFIIDNFYRYKKWEILPNNPFDRRFTQKLQSTLSAIEDITPHYYNKYLKKSYTIDINDSLSYLKDWSREVSLKEILTKSIEKKLSNTEELDNILDDISKKSYSIPKLLKPVLDIQSPENPILNFVEMGAYSPLSRRLIEVGVPRETAIRIKNLIAVEYGKNYTSQEMDDKIIFKLLKQIKENLNYWEKIQIEGFID